MVETRNLIAGVAIALILLIGIKVVLGSDIIPNPNKPVYTAEVTVHRNLIRCWDTDIQDVEFKKGRSLNIFFGIPGTTGTFTVDAEWTGPEGTTVTNNELVKLGCGDTRTVKLNLKAEDGAGDYRYMVRVLTETGEEKDHLGGVFKVVT